MRHAGGFLLATFICASTLVAGNSSKVIRAVRCDGQLAQDGLLHDWRWQAATPVSDFTQYYPDEGAAPTEHTSVRILFDDNALYVGVICYDSDPRGIVSQLTRRDRTAEADRFTVQIDSYHDHQTAFVFSTSVAGVQSDGFLAQDGTIYDLSYDAVWQVNTARHSEGWSAEFVIPYNAIRFSPQNSQQRTDSSLRGQQYEWGINFRRYISRKRETDEWVLVPSSERLLIDKWGHVDGIERIAPPLHLSIVPYVSATAEFATETSYRPRKSDLSENAGLDFKYGISRNFTLDAAINPDFGQVEVDQSILNLTVFETLYPEKRPFFVEGSQMFEFGNAVDNTPLNLFYSRRIGQIPLYSSYVASLPDVTVEENPRATTILGALKMTGQTESGFSLGLLASATDEENAVVRDHAGVKSTIRTEPRGTYNILRVKQQFGSSRLGGIATVAARNATFPAFSGGIDWNLRFEDGAYTLDGYLAGVHSSSSRRNPDGSAGRLLFSRIAAEHWYYTLSYNFFSANFNPNDLGYFAQPRYHGGYVQLLYRENKASGWLRRYSLSVVPETRWNWDDARTHAQIDATFSADWTNFWRSTLRFVLNDRAYDDAQRGINGLYLRPVSYGLQASLITDERKPVNISLTTDFKFDEKRKSSIGTLVGVTVRPTSWIELTPLFYLEKTTNEETGVFDFATRRIAADTLGRSLIADRDLADIEFAMRGIFTFTRTLSLQFYTQMLLPRGQYKNYRSLAATGQLIPYPSQDYDFNTISFQSNVLLRWEYLPGSTLYLVWTQSRDDFIDDYTIDFGPRFRDAFKLPHDDALLLKVSYWWGV
ncbi:MAG: carbohydrate binding family 9 domain-containing protein [Ignavibacteriae bacterium]|nr:carbohydrate binding family 9 domain-containing protein [Ignavibacteriota bacterium]